MIISHKHKFIFLKTNKTAGTSIEIALSKCCGPDDIITTISPEDEKTRNQLGYPGAQNYLAPIQNYSFRDIVKSIFRRKLKPRYYNHMSASNIRACVGEDIWNNYYKFCFERNPWDRVISLYYWRCRSGPRPSISEFLDSKVPLALKRRGFDVYTINEKIAVNKVCRFENISEELQTIRKKLNIKEELNLPHAKSGFRKDKRSYRDILDNSSRAKIEKLFKDEIEIFNYEF